MKEYKADLKEQKRIYRHNRRKYKRWKYGLIGTLLCLGVTAFLIKWMISEAGGFSLYILPLSAGLNFIPFLIGGICLAWAVSGDSDLIRRRSGCIRLENNGLVMEYIPKRMWFRAPEYAGYVIYRMRYSDITGMTYEADKMRVGIFGNYQVTYYFRRNQGNSAASIMSEEVKESFFYLYACYEHFDECMETISRESGIHSSPGILPCRKNSAGRENIRGGEERYE